MRETGKMIGEGIVIGEIFRCDFVRPPSRNMLGARTHLDMRSFAIPRAA